MAHGFYNYCLQNQRPSTVNNFYEKSIYKTENNFVAKILVKAGLPTAARANRASETTELIVPC
jgi:hypothetical protein